MGIFNLFGRRNEEEIELSIKKPTEAERLSVIPKRSSGTRLVKEIEFQKQRRLTTEEKINILRSAETGRRLGTSLSAFGRVPEQDFSFHEQVLRETFGRGDHIWGTNMQPVEMNHDLNPRQRGDFSTAELFGF